MLHTVDLPFYFVSFLSVATMSLYFSFDECHSENTFEYSTCGNPTRWSGLRGTVQVCKITETGQIDWCGKG